MGNINITYDGSQETRDIAFRVLVSNHMSKLTSDNNYKKRFTEVCTNWLRGMSRDRFKNSFEMATVMIDHNNGLISLLVYVGKDFRSLPAGIKVFSHDFHGNQKAREGFQFYQAHEPNIDDIMNKLFRMADEYQTWCIDVCNSVITGEISHWVPEVFRPEYMAKQRDAERRLIQLPGQGFSRPIVIG